MTPPSDTVIIIGAGPAGLAAAETLAKRNIEYVILEKGLAVASALRRVDPEMRLLSPKAVADAGHESRASDADLTCRSASSCMSFERYQQQHELKVNFDCTVQQIRKSETGSRFVIAAATGRSLELRGSHVINATGIISQPWLPDNFLFEGRRWRHSVDTRGKISPVHGRFWLSVVARRLPRFLRIGCEERQEGDRAWLSLRSRLIAIPHWIFGIDVHYFSWLPEQIPTGLFGWRAGRLTEPMTGRAVVRGIRGLIKRMPAVRSYKGWEVEFENGERLEPDLIVFATGFRYALEHLKEVVDLDPDGRPLVKNWQSTRVPGMFLLGYRFGRTFASPYLRGIARDAEYVAERIARDK